MGGKRERARCGYLHEFFPENIQQDYQRITGVNTNWSYSGELSAALNTIPDAPVGTPKKP